MTQSMTYLHKFLSFSLGHLLFFQIFTFDDKRFFFKELGALKAILVSKTTNNQN
jgi:hypothetical protein